jgi:hypothetical protein
MKELFTKLSKKGYTIHNKRVIGDPACTSEAARNKDLTMELALVIDWLETKGFFINTARVFSCNVSPPKVEGWNAYIGLSNPEEELDCNDFLYNNLYKTRKEATIAGIEYILKELI